MCVLEGFMDNDVSQNQSSNQASTNKSDDALAQAKKEMEEEGINYEDIIKKDVLELMGFSNLSEEKKSELHNKIKEAIENRVAARIFEALPEEERNKYSKIIEVGDAQEGYQFLISRDIDAAKWLAEETIMMKIELYQDGQMVKKQAAKLAASQAN